MTKSIKKFLAIASILAVAAFAVAAPSARAENEKESASDDKVANVSSSHEREGENEVAKSHVRTKSHKTKKRSRKHVVSKNPSTVVTTPAVTPVTPATPVASYTMAQVATANSKAKCWTAISGKVYNLTDWIAQHPGGEGAILSICGKDGTAAFNARHGGQGRPAQELKSFLIGTLN